ncbi:MAG: 16S rRNA (cytidine(1402)-2'-O)-methyltransferase [Clostridiaceae bacterium]|jgi:16S rRNA (cytidine1402-2'-O)-methyltransferase|nr:16S rRNA (cytidine(1402)-2'-O)-methyltransferase [Clostridiaceae bacterium]
MGELLIVGTPIGNLKDISLRALDALKSADFILCEDTRHSRILLDAYGIEKPLVSYHMHNERERAAEITELLAGDKTAALITDAGMPCISDPGAVLVNEARKQNIKISVIPGPSAVTAAAALVGLTEHGFMFLGFIPDKTSDKTAFLEKYKSFDLPLIFYSAPHDVQSDLKALHAAYGKRRVRTVKEITKIHETEEEGFLGEFIPSDLRGEFVLIVDGAEFSNPLNSLSVRDHAAHYVSLGFSKMDAAKQTAADRGISKKEVYPFTIDL